MNAPRVRFKGFDGEWEEKRLGDIAERYDNLRIPIKESIRVKGSTPYYGANGIQDYVDGYTHDGEYVLVAEDGANDLDNYPVIYVVGKIWVNNHAHVLQAIKNYSTAFFKYRLQCSNIKSVIVGGSRAKLNAAQLMNINILFPSFAEQLSIASYFQYLDSLIQSTTKTIDSLKQVKAASLQSMFPQEGETVPRVRFKGFEGEWKKVALGVLFKERTERNCDGEMLSVTMNNGIIKASENGRFDNSSEDKSNYKVVKVGDIAYNTMRMWQGASGCSQYEGIVSPAYTIVIPNDDVNSSFFSYYFKTIDAINMFKLYSQGLTKDTWNLKYPAFGSIKLYYPNNLIEQQNIASYFTSLDRQITLQTQRLEKLKRIKAACLEKMFV